jgi:hypothetical protein
MAGLSNFLSVGKKDHHERKSRSPWRRLAKRDESAKLVAEASKEGTPFRTARL